MKNPPILISVIGFFGMIAGFYWLYLGLRLLGFDWFGVLGDLPAFEQTGLWGWLAIGAGHRLDRGRARPVGAPAVGLDVRDHHGRHRAVRGVPLVPRVPGYRRRLQCRDHAAHHHLLPELARGAGQRSGSSTPNRSPTGSSSAGSDRSDGARGARGLPGRQFDPVARYEQRHRYRRRDPSRLVDELAARFLEPCSPNAAHPDRP